MVYKDATWVQIKALVDGGSELRYIEKPCKYLLFVFENNEIHHECNLFRASWPVACYMTREENDQHVADFEQNYKASAREI